MQLYVTFSSFLLLLFTFIMRILLIVHLIIIVFFPLYIDQSSGVDNGVHESDELALIISPVSIVGYLSFCIAFALENEEERMLKELLRPPSEADDDVSYTNYVNIKGQMNQNFDLFYFSSILVKCV